MYFDYRKIPILRNVLVTLGDFDVLKDVLNTKIFEQILNDRF